MGIPATQQRITLLRRPKARIDPVLTGSGTFLLEKDVPVPRTVDAGEVLVAVEWLSLDPAMRGASVVEEREGQLMRRQDG